MQVVFDHNEEIAERIMTFWFKPLQPIDFIAGQFTQLHLPHNNPDERGDKRWFTISASPTEELLSITTKFAPSGSSTFKLALQALKPGTHLVLADPMGDFVLPKDITTPLLFIAAGMGITPIHSMLTFLHDNHEKRVIHLVYSVKHAQEFAWLELFESTEIRFTPLVTKPSDMWKGETSSLTAPRIAAWAQENKHSLVYLSGPETMIEQFARELPTLGISHDRLVTDYYPGYEPV